MTGFVDIDPFIALGVIEGLVKHSTCDGSDRSSNTESAKYLMTVDEDVGLVFASNLTMSMSTIEAEPLSFFFNVLVFCVTCFI
mmetsp:Transcript_22691/g.40611  ORF Transcript_22691/g.40611 Transcript_22691/m.40611 type:complete len:83 (+) Transcript_22691:2523-2771(+)